MNQFYLKLIALIVLIFTQCQPKEDRSTETEDKNVGPGNVETIGSIERLDSAVNSIIKKGADIEILADGFSWSEGPLWVPDLNSLIYSDVPKNTIYKWNETEGNSVFLQPSGFTDIAPASEGEGSNGLTFDHEGNLIICQHGDRRLVKIIKEQIGSENPDIISVIDNYNEKRFNSPNDAVTSSNGDIYFTDPPYGLKDQDSDSLKELDFNGVYKLSTEGELSLLIDDLSRPNGIALSQDEQTLYVANSDSENAIWMAYDIISTGVENGRVFFDATDKVPGLNGLPDGLKINKEGIIFASGPGGVLIFNPEGEHLGTILTELTTANCAFNEDESILYMTTQRYLTRVRLK